MHLENLQGQGLSPCCRFMFLEALGDKNGHGCFHKDCWRADAQVSGKVATPKFGAVASIKTGYGWDALSFSFLPVVT
jgi:hypothetical protein